MILHSGFFGPRKSRRLCSFLFQHRAGKRHKKVLSTTHQNSSRAQRFSLTNSFFSEMGSSEILCEAKNGQNCFPIVKNYGLWKWSSSLHKGHHPVGPHSQWSPTIKRVFSLSVPLKHTYEKNRIKSISGESKRAKKESRRRRTNETWKNECISII